MHAIEKRKSPLSTFVDSVYDKDAVNFWLKKLNSLWSVNQALGKIVKKENVANDMTALTIRCNRVFKQGLAGQHHPVTVEINGRRYERTYSLSNVDADHVVLTVKKVEQGLVSSWLNQQAQVGDIIEFGTPYGDMLVPKDTTSLVLLAAGSGITPMYSLIQSLKQTAKLKQMNVQLLYWVKKHGDAAYLQQFEQLAQQYPNLQLHVYYTQSDDPDERLNVEHLNIIPELSQSIVYACGPSGFVASAETLFENAQAFMGEAFSMTPIENDDVGFVNVTLTQSNKVVAIPKGESILVALEHQNIKPTHGCRMGICHKCVCHKVEGSTKNLLDGSLNPEPGNQLRICVNSAQSDLVIDL
ncbi:ferredoxin reductase [Acinetobacter stercoris]|uniref:Stearoyl-CoA 9-desaturase electron transfer partner n=1 Tax=Acinetobacter stercoris TaxID=2126983 RepID=A0A2U3N2C2_9GAMM|nr:MULTISPECIES: ferredoxin reductase [Acinetobacter]SPL71818.1 Stearoyl-CoA 9-desaturase electron transfer partner [Acinetobacter stercoris]